MTIDDEPEAAEMGDDNTIVGDVPVKRMGSGNTIVGATDALGNSIIDTGGTAIGREAKADSTSVAIGAGTMAGDGLLLPLLGQYEASLVEHGQTEAAEQARDVIDAVRAGDASRGRRLWGAIKVGVTLGELATLAAQIAPLIHDLSAS